MADISGHDDDSGEFAGLGGDAGRHVAAQTVADHEDFGAVDLGLGAQQSHARHGIFHRLVFHRVAGEGRHLDAILPGTLLVAQHDDAIRGQPLRQILEYLGAAHGLIAIVGTRAVHQHDRREGARRPPAR